MIRRTWIRLAQIDESIRGDRWRALVRWVYQGLAPVYDTAQRLVFPEYSEVIAEMLARLALSSNDRVLDLGCGTGRVTLPAVEKACWGVGIDMTPSMLAELRRNAAERGGPQPELVRSDTRFLPLADDSVTVATTSFMLLHLRTAEKQQVFREVRRVLSDGGRFGCLTSRHTISDAYPTGEEWRVWLTEAGFDDVTVADVRDVYRIVTARAGATV